MTPVRLSLFFLVLCAGSLSAWIAVREHTSFLIGKTPLLADVQSSQDVMALPLSTLGRTQRLMRCATGMTSLEMRLLPVRDQKQLGEGCRNLANEVLRTNPSRALAHLTLAIAADQASDFPTMQTALIHAQSNAPKEGWLADWRMRLALSHYPNLSQAARIGFENDVALLMGTPVLRQAVVAQYLGQESARELLIAIAEQQPATIQNAFLNEIRAGLGA